MLLGLVIGCGINVFDEAEAALRLFEPDAIFLVNDMIAKWPKRADYFCSLHAENLYGWISERERNKFPMGAEVWSDKGHPYKVVEKTATDWQGSSGLFAVKVALVENFDKLVIAGIPMETKHNHIERNREIWATAASFHPGWIANKVILKARVRSMSGWTKNLLGEPTKEWLESEIV